MQHRSIRPAPGALWLAIGLIGICGCGGAGAGASRPTHEAGELASTSMNLGPLVTRVVGTAQTPVFSSAAGGANVTGVAGALISGVVLNAQGPPTLDDTKIVFASYFGGSYEICSMNADGSGRMRLTNNAASDYYPAWSPDGAKIAFTSYQDGNNEIYTMSPDGSNPVRLTNSTAADSKPTWSPDGGKIAFVSERDGNNEIYAMNADGSSPTRLTNSAALDYSPAWSPDGGKIAFVSERDGNSEIYTMNADGNGLRRLTNNAASDSLPAWSPDGGKIAFVSYRDSNNEIYTMSPDGSNPVRLTNNTASDFAPAWSPDGGKIVFQSNREGSGLLYTMNASGTGQSVISRTAGTNDIYPAWSPFFSRSPQTLIGRDGTLGTRAAGLLYGMKGAALAGMVAFDTAADARAGARVAALSAEETLGTNLVFSLTATGLSSLAYTGFNRAGVPTGAVVNPSIPSGTTGALVSFDAATGGVVAVLPYAANRSVSRALTPVREGGTLLVRGRFLALFNGAGENLAPQGASAVRIDAATGALQGFE